MSKWYHRASWGILMKMYAPHLLRKRAVDTQGLSTLPDTPFILLSDHANALDAYVLGALVGKPIRFMANLEGVSRIKSTLALLVGAYGRRKGSNDMSALRTTFSLSRAGETIGMFPEGDRSWDGSTLSLRPGCGKLVRRLALTWFWRGIKVITSHNRAGRPYNDAVDGAWIFLYSMPTNWHGCPTTLSIRLSYRP
jgi:hypothetical protein